MYRGRAAGSLWSSSGGGANYQCITEEPENFDFGSGNSANPAYMYGAEYEMNNSVPTSSQALNEQDVPCVVCYVTTHVAVLMIPGKYTFLMRNRRRRRVLCAHAEFLPSVWIKQMYGYTSEIRTCRLRCVSTYV